MTTIEYIDYYENKNEQYLNIFSRKYCFENVRDRLFPLNNDICYTQEDVINLLRREVPFFRYFMVKFIDIVLCIFMTKEIRNEKKLFFPNFKYFKNE
jgi:hypothetical protein